MISTIYDLKNQINNEGYIMNNLKTIVLILLVSIFSCTTSVLATSAYFLPANYDGSSAAADVSNITDYPPICNSSDNLEGLDLVRAFTGASTCPRLSASQSLASSVDVVLLVDDTQPISSYLVSMLQIQNALDSVGSRQIVKPTRINFPVASNTFSILVVGEEAYRTGLSAEGWFSVIDGLSTAQSTSANTVKNRINWTTFKTTPQFAQYQSAVRTMRANSDATDPNSWLYWANIHESSCPHTASYFLAWHRGYIYLFEKKIQELSGNANFRLPYWDYYSDPNMPSEFTDSSSSNPFYVAGRTNTNVRSALSLSPFSNSLVNFQRGETNAFEPPVESRPHNPVHNIIGAPYMLGLQSPQDPIFWVHHANIDRLWSAWLAAGNGRSMPPVTSAYWASSLPNRRTYSGTNFKYGSSLTLARNMTFDTRQSLKYDYDDKTMPTSIPSAAPVRPSGGSSGASSGSSSGSANGSTAMILNEESVTLPLPVSELLASNITTAKQSGTTSNDLGLALAIKGVELTANGREAGFDYFVYLNLPTTSSSSIPEENHFIGTIGPFEIAGLDHEHHSSEHSEHGTLKLPIPNQVLEFAIDDAREIEISFIRVNGDNSPSGEVITIREMELVSEPNSEPLNIS